MTLLSLFALAALNPAEAIEVGSRPFGLGVVLGDPTGLSAKYYLGGPTNAVDFALAFDTYSNNGATNGWMMNASMTAVGAASSASSSPT